ncbi:MAG: hypothetical protein HKN85_09940 [Gammaproteobacteria bacterium]|nr:hypothetical protein [Gammaproteobacteria bacterium]
MQWALLAAILIGLFMISGRHPKIAFGIFAALVIGVSVMMLVTSDRADKIRNKITAEDITVENMIVAPAYGGSYRISGRLHNHNSQASLRETILTVFMLDCTAQTEDNCLVVGQQSERLNTRVPAGQARDFNINLYFGSPRIGGHQRWRFEIASARS